MLKNNVEVDVKVKCIMNLWGLQLRHSYPCKKSVNQY